MTFLELLEQKHFGQLAPETIHRYANTSADFANQWLVHAIRSNSSAFELTLAFASAMKWQTQSLKELKSYLGNASETGEYTELDQYATQVTNIVTDVCIIELKALLKKLFFFSKHISQKLNLDSNKYTQHIYVKDEQLAKIIKDTTPQLQDVSLFGQNGKSSQDNEIRNNKHFPTPLPNNSISLALLEYLLAKSAGKAIHFAEPPVILRYQPGEYYKWHYDHIYPHTADIQQHIDQFGQRVKTAIFYFNDDFVGGETEFKEPFISVSPKKNTALLFDNCNDELIRDTSSIHRGTPVIEGEKWIMTLWFRSKPFWLRSGLL